MIRKFRRAARRQAWKGAIKKYRKSLLQRALGL